MVVTAESKTIPVGSPAVPPVLEPRASSPQSGNPGVGVLAITFALALVIRISFNLWLPHINNFAACDAYEYIQNARALISLGQTATPSLWNDCFLYLIGNADASAVQHVHNAFEGMKDFAISGPVFPAYLALTLLLTGSAALPDYAAWPHMLVGQSVLSAVMCVFIALAAGRCFDKRAAVVAGLMAAFYPGFVVNSGRLYSESFACVLLSALIWLTVRGFQNGGNALTSVFLTGFLACCLQLSRSVMAALSLALLPLTWLTARKTSGKAGTKSGAFIAVLVLLLGFAIPALPWLGFQKLAFGGGGLVVDRVGRYNFFVGNNVDIGGWLSYPYPDGRGVESRAFPTLFKEAVSKNPQRWFKLMLDKPARLFKFPWNDFKTPVGPLEHTGQVVFHQVLLFLAAAGLLLGSLTSGTSAKSDSFSVAPNTVGRGKTYARLFVIALFAFHCIYYLFITVPRYNLTSIPEVIIFAAAGLVAFYDLVRRADTRSNACVLIGSICLLAAVLWTPCLPLLIACFPGMPPAVVLWSAAACKLALLVVVAVNTFKALGLLNQRGLITRMQAGLLFLFLAPAICYPARAHGRWFEWSSQLDVARGPVRQSMTIPVEKLRSSDVYLIVDSDSVKQFSDGLSLRINGVSLNDQPVIAGLSLAEGFDRVLEVSPGIYQREGERQWDSLTAAAGIGNIDLRQWSLILIPPELINAATASTSEINSDRIQLDIELSNSSAEKFGVFGSYKQSSKERSLPSVDIYSWEKCFYGVENPAGLTDTRYESKAAASHVAWVDNDLSEQPGRQSGAYNFGILVAPPVGATVSPSVPASEYSALPLSGAHTRIISSTPVLAARLDASKGDVCEVKLGAPFVSPNANVVLVRMRGQLKSSHNDVTGALAISGDFASGGSTSAVKYRSPWTARALKTNGASWKDFDTTVPLPSSLKGNSLTSLGVTLSCTPAAFGYKNVYTPLTGCVEFRNLQLEVLEMGANPLSAGHVVY